MKDVFNILIRQLQDANTSWSIGAFGAIAEFHQATNEWAEIRVTADWGKVVTKRGAIQIARHTETRLIPYEIISKKPDAWSQGVMVCLPTNTARLNITDGVADLGPDKAALMPSDNERLFDLDFHFEHFQGCVRTANPALQDALNSAKKIPFLKLSNWTIQTLKSVNPVRVFRCRIARIEVAQSIPDRGESTPLGPHTHVLPSLLTRHQSQAATIPIPDGFTAVLAFYPPNPVQNKRGALKAFDPTSFNAFQTLIDEYGIPKLTEAKQKAREMLNLGITANKDVLPKDRHARMAFRVALRQWEYLNGRSTTSVAWRQLCDRTIKNKKTFDIGP